MAQGQACQQRQSPWPAWRRLSPQKPPPPSASLSMKRRKEPLRCQASSSSAGRQRSSSLRLVSWVDPLRLLVLWKALRFCLCPGVGFSSPSPELHPETAAGWPVGPQRVHLQGRPGWSLRGHPRLLVVAPPLEAFHFARHHPVLPGQTNPLRCCHSRRINPRCRCSTAKKKRIPPAWTSNRLLIDQGIIFLSASERLITLWPTESLNTSGRCSLSSEIRWGGGSFSHRLQCNQTWGESNPAGQYARCTSTALLSAMMLLILLLELHSGEQTAPPLFLAGVRWAFRWSLALFLWQTRFILTSSLP